MEELIHQIRTDSMGLLLYDLNLFWVIMEMKMGGKEGLNDLNWILPNVLYSYKSKDNLARTKKHPWC